MTKQEEKIREVQSVAKQVGHCLCSKLFKCPCNYFRDKKICKCSEDEKTDINMEEWINYNTK